MEEPRLKQIVRPLIALIIMITLSVAIFVKAENPQLLDRYTIWGAIVVSTYFGIRQIEKYINRKK